MGPRLPRRDQAVNDGRTRLTLLAQRLIASVGPAVQVLVHVGTVAEVVGNRRVDLFERQPRPQVHDPSNWLELAVNFGRLFQRVVGRPSSIARQRNRHG